MRPSAAACKRRTGVGARADGSLKAGLKGKRKSAAWDDHFMATLMAG